ncbi:IS110 family transposase [Lactobacillus sp. ESL0791]|uniref:IS110 family transposase n=1 Tax=Lactobacillus sp. ESL0791 TaxID=2983234 RepID=UPI0023F8D472|nr:IS110 family transposase [Lactobacillus sp. ESL0791]MDF7638615.1 IS110 family transposase [Lactobacillus sp. ESL0791]
MNNLVVVGIDVSSHKSAVCMMLNKQIIKQFNISNDAIGFKQLLAEISFFKEQPQIVFEATGVYSCRLQTFLNQHHYRYTMLNPLKAKLQLNQFRKSKTDQHDARDLAYSQFIYHRAPTYLQDSNYQQLSAMSRFYEQLTHDLIAAKNRLHRVLQFTFPELESLICHPDGLNYWRYVQTFTHPQVVKNLGYEGVMQCLLNFHGIGKQRADRLATKLLKLADKSYPAVAKTAFEVEEARYYAQRLMVLFRQRKEIIQRMSDLANQLPNHDLKILESIPGISEITAVRLLGELGDIRRFRNPNALNAFVGLDLRHYQSGEMELTDHISKRGNPIGRKILYRVIGQMDSVRYSEPCHITNYYEQKKRSSQSKNFKKIAIAAVHKLTRTVYYLIVHDQLYDYSVVKK